MRKYHFFIALLVIALDRITKWAIAQKLSLHDSIPVIPGFFRIIRTENRGAAFGLFADSPSEWKVGLLILFIPTASQRTGSAGRLSIPTEWKVGLLILFSLVALLIVSALLWKNSHSLTTTGIGLALILGGAIGNLWDRVVSGHVVDFLLFYVGQYQWPAFNLADSAIVVGAGLLVFEILFTKSPTQKTA